MHSMRRFVILLAIVTLIGACASEPASEASAPTAATDAANAAGAAALGADGEADADTFYALGVALAQQVQVFSLSEAEFDNVVKGMRDVVTGAEPKVDLAAYNEKLSALAQSRQAAQAGVEKQASATFLEEASKTDGAERTDSGLIFVSLTEGSGASPAATDTVKVHYTGKLRDGSVFDSSVERGQPATFPLNQVIRCWTEGVAKMKVGGKARLVCPSDIAYGDQGRPGIPPGAALDFEVELLEIVAAAAPQPQP
ncbi:MAG: FKBP-type peptidyl-prolyl cis-trans isomerase [Acidobacteriota bacterium]